MCEALRHDLYLMIQKGENSVKQKAACFNKTPEYFKKACNLFGIEIKPNEKRNTTELMNDLYLDFLSFTI